MEQPPRFVAQGESGKECRLRKSLYGLKQNTRAWFGKFSQALECFGMKKVHLIILYSIGDLTMVLLCLLYMLMILLSLEMMYQIYLLSKLSFRVNFIPKIWPFGATEVFFGY